MERVDTFDLLLFKIDNSSGKLIRLATASEWGKLFTILAVILIAFL